MSVPMQKRFRLCLKLAHQSPSFSAKTVRCLVFGCENVGTDWNRRLKVDNLNSAWPEYKFCSVLAETGSRNYFRLFEIRHICWQLGYFQSSWKNYCGPFIKTIQSRSFVDIVLYWVWSLCMQVDSVITHDVWRFTEYFKRIENLQGKPLLRIHQYIETVYI